MAKKKKGTVSKYKDRTYSEQTIQRVLYAHFKDMNYKMANVYMFGKWESDFFFMDKIKQLWEIEIKVDRQDYDRDFKLKPKKHSLFKAAFENTLSENVLLPNKFYFCAPEGVIPHKSLPEYAGLIEIYGTNKDNVRYVTPPVNLHDNVRDVRDILLKKFYNKTLNMENLLSDFRIKLFENDDPEKESEIVHKFIKRIRM